LKDRFGIGQKLLFMENCSKRVPKPSSKFAS
jgi:hypothetical protein